MALIALSDFTDRHEDDLDAEEQARVTTLIDDASALVVAAVNDATVTDTWDPTAPDAVVPVIYRMVRRAFVNPDGLESETIGAYTWRRGGEPGIFMTKDERRQVVRAAGKLSAGTLDFEGQMPLATRPLGTWLDGAL